MRHNCIHLSELHTIFPYIIILCDLTVTAVNSNSVKHNSVKLLYIFQACYIDTIRCIYTLPHSYNAIKL